MRLKELRLRFRRLSWRRFLRRSWVGFVITAAVFVVDHWSRIEFLIGKLRALPVTVADIWAWSVLHQQAVRTSILLFGLIWITVAALRTARESSSESELLLRRSVSTDALLLLGKLFEVMAKSYDEFTQKAVITVDESREWRDFVSEFKAAFPLASEKLRKARTREEIQTALKPLAGCGKTPENWRSRRADIHKAQCF